MLAEWVGEVSRRYLARRSCPRSPAPRRPPDAELAAGRSTRGRREGGSRGVGHGIAPALARALRSGLLDELGWPAWEEAVDAPESRESAPGGRPRRRCLAAPHRPRPATPPGDRCGGHGAHARLSRPRRRSALPQNVSSRYVDGELFVWWRSRTAQTASEGYWHARPVACGSRPGLRSARVSTVDGRDGLNGNVAPVSLPLPGGGRTTGNGVLRRGDTVVPRARQVIRDGTSYWVWARRRARLPEPDLVRVRPSQRHERRTRTAGLVRRGRACRPGGKRLRGGLAAAAPSDEPGPMCAPVDGLLGWRVVTLPDGSRRGEDLAGRSVVVPPGRGSRRSPRWVLEFPGADRPLAVVQEYDDQAVRQGPAR